MILYMCNHLCILEFTVNQRRALFIRVDCLLLMAQPENTVCSWVSVNSMSASVSVSMDVALVVFGHGARSKTEKLPSPSHSVRGQQAPPTFHCAFHRSRMWIWQTRPFIFHRPKTDATRDCFVCELQSYRSRRCDGRDCLRGVDMNCSSFGYRFRFRFERLYLKTYTQVHAHTHRAR